MMSPLKAGLLLLAFSPMAFAQEPAAVPLEIAACAKIRKNSERLACFDRAVTYLQSGPAADGSKPAPSEEDMFGIGESTPSPVSARKEDQDSDKSDSGQLDAIKAKVKSVQSAPGGVILELDNGQTWRQTSGSSTLLIKTGDEIKITRGALGSFNLMTPSGRAAKVKRVQ